MESGGGEKGQPTLPAQEDNQPNAGHDSQPKFRALFAYSGQHEDELSFQVFISRFRDILSCAVLSRKAPKKHPKFSQNVQIKASIADRGLNLTLGVSPLNKS